MERDPRGKGTHHHGPGVPILGPHRVDLRGILRDKCVVYKCLVDETGTGPETPVWVRDDRTLDYRRLLFGHY